MKLAIVGLGYVGITTAAAFSKLGHTIIGYENNIKKLATLTSGELPITEPEVGDILIENRERIYYREKIESNINEADLVFVSVGTPTSEAGETDLTALNGVMEELSRFGEIDLPIVIRSTIPIGLSRQYAVRYPNLNILFHPEFLREGTAVQDFFNPPKIVFGAGVQSDNQLRNLVDTLYEGFDCPKFFVSYEAAESVKYADNIFHALKVAFTNEISKVVASKGADPREVMRIFRSDEQLNISPAYLKPGFAYGGSCLEKDLASFRTQAQNLNIPLLLSVTESNETIVNEFVGRIARQSDTFILNGLTFKEKVDDLRRSPFVSIAMRLLDLGNEVYAYDDNLETTFGESRQIFDRLLANPRFHINEACPAPSGNPIVVYCHRNRHEYLVPSFVADYELFAGGDAGRNFA